ncbi:integrase core domain-containing protein, partial [Nocardia sp. NPDC049149]|uniref:integrase core domain-containing protein n=1 Tax=Nocardia sp. NPDC049149 TaxID=3364315 RepID=UPI00371EB0E4
SDGRHPPKPSTSTYNRYNKPVLLPPIESSQYTSMAFTETLALEGIAASIGSIGDAYDNALAESTIGLFKTEALGPHSPFLTGALRTLDDVEYTTMEWIDWYNNQRLHSLLDHTTPEEYEAAYYSQQPTPQPESSPA